MHQMSVLLTKAGGAPLIVPWWNCCGLTAVPGGVNEARTVPVGGRLSLACREEEGQPGGFTAS
jgi:hypothetical protein